jgi:hypothetical protein
VLGGVVVEREQRVQVIGDLRGGLGELGPVSRVKAAAGRDSGTDPPAPANGQPGDRCPLTRWVPALAAAVVASIAVAVTGCGSSHHEQGSAAAASSAGLSNPPVTPSSTESPGGVAACRASQLTASIARRGSTASAPFLIVTLRNSAAGPCTLSGYPGVAVYTAASTAPVPIAIQHGTYERPDPGPHMVQLPAGGLASFALGTSTAYSGGMNVTITKITIRLSDRDTTAVPVNIPGGLGATSNQSAPLPVGITAFAAGNGG